jgi:hypothetical protein
MWNGSVALLRNLAVRSRTNRQPASLLLKRACPWHLRWFGHVTLVDQAPIPKALLEWWPETVGGKRQRGWWRISWMSFAPQSTILTFRSQEGVMASCLYRNVSQFWRSYGKYATILFLLGHAVPATYASWCASPTRVRGRWEGRSGLVVHQTAAFCQLS